jgi:hypothetical protein
MTEAENDPVSALAAEDQREASPDLINDIKELAAIARVQERNVAKLSERLTEAKRMLDHTLTRDLPELMDKAGIPSITIEDGSHNFTVSVKTSYNANIAATWDAERRKTAFDWLDRNGHGSLIKTEVVTNFPRDDRDEVANFIGYLDMEGYSYLKREGVHSGTLSSWLREMITSGRTPPLDVIGGYVERVAKIKEET